MTTATPTAKGRVFWDDIGRDGWQGIVSRFQFVILAGLRSKQLFRGALPRIPADPLKRRNTTIALEELRQGLVPFGKQNGIESQAVPAPVEAVIEQGGNYDLSPVE